ncbi:MAG: exosortase/archaeosortase family protein [Candidatus Latescibacterota bacterium]|jgi:exosortase/archaeosortase family protein
MIAYDKQGQSGFALRFVLSMVVLTMVYSYLEPLFGYSYLYPLSLVSATLLDLSGVPNDLYAFIDQGFCALQMERNLFHIEYECTGVFTLCIYLVTVIVYPVAWVAKVRGVALGISAFFAYGVLRVFGLGLISHWLPSWLDFFHIYLMVALNLGFLLFLWAFWVNRWTLHVPENK